MTQATALTGGASFGDGDLHWSQRQYLGLSGLVWARIGVVATLFITLFWPNLRRLWLKTNPLTGEANWGHSFFVPLIGLYYLYLNRDALLKANVRGVVFEKFTRPSRLYSGAAALLLGALLWGAGIVAHNAMLERAGQFIAAFGFLVLAVDWGIGVTVFGMLVYAYGIHPGQNDFIKDFGMVITLFGVVTLLCGWEVMKIAWFPIVLLACAIPWPALLYSRVAMPLQQLSASVAVGTLRLVGVSDAVRSGTKILMGGQALNVAEACAGMKSLMTFITVAAAVAFLSSRVMWQKIVITLSAIPIAIFCNMSRVTVQGLLSHLGYHEWSEDFAHAFVGLVMMVPAFFLILLVAYILDNIFIEEADRRRLGAAAGKGDQVGLIIEVPRPGGIASRKPVVGNMDRPVPAPAESPKPVPAKAPSEPMAAPAAAATAAPAAASSSAEDLAAATRRLAAGGSIRRSQPSGLGRKPASPAAQTQPQNDGEKK